ncbi:SH3 domain-containing protein [Clostridium sardiniense]|uniref:VgrG-related protein n=1 Tax=Clostridium sardiniense TaxID=29369 RepID=UPI003D34C2EE
MKRESIIKMLILSAVVAGFTPNLEANAATLINDNTKNISSDVKTGWINKDGKRYYVQANGELAKYLKIIDGKTYYFNGEGQMVTGWLKFVSSNEWHYFNENGVMQKGWLTLGDKKYYLDDSGARVTGKVKIDNKEYNFDENGVLKESKTGWITRDGKRYYVQANGELAKYLNTINGETYYFNGQGELVTGWLKFISSNEWHYFNENGVMQKGWLTLGDKKYYLDDSGARVTGKVKIDNKEYNFDENGVLKESETGWITRDGKRYYVKDNGELAKYLNTINGETYYFNGQGELVTGWLKFISSNEWHYFNEDGAMQKGWLTLGDKKYYLDDSGARVTGKVKIDNKEYNFDENGVLKELKTGWIARDGKRYYIKDNGELAKYLNTIDGEIYYFNGKGEMVTGWLKFISSNEWRYFNEDGAMQKGFLNLDGKTYYIQDDGSMAKYLKNIDGKTYYFNSEGQMVTGWLKFANNNEWHYFNKDGAMQKGFLNLDGKTYYMQDDGSMARYSKTINGKIYYFNSEGEMVTGWLRFISNNEWHYYNNDGSMQKGWLTLGDKKYYLDNSGARVTGQMEIDGEMYEFNNDGVLKDNPFGAGKLTDFTMNLRSEPSLNSEVLTTMSPNSKVEILGRVKGDLTYYHVKYVNNGHTYYGYVSIYLNGSTAVQVYDDNRDDDYLGILSEKYESNGDPGSVSSGEGDYGGKSYGAWQLSSNMGSLGDFINWLSGKNDSFYKELTDARKLDNGSYGKHFDDAWRDIAKNHYNEFYNLQHEYTKITFYDDLIKRLKNSGDYTSVLNNFAAKNVLWSTAVQHGGYGAYKIIAPLTHTTNVEDFITSVYKERGRRDSDGNLVYFRSSSKAVQEGVASRYIREKDDAIRMYRDSL